MLSILPICGRLAGNKYFIKSFHELYWESETKKVFKEFIVEQGHLIYLLY